MKYQIRHVTRYDYASPVSQCYNRAHLLPRDTDTQTCLHTRVRIAPLPATAQQRIDYFGNSTYHFALEDPHTSLTIDVESEIEVLERPKFNAFDLDLGVTCAEARNLIRRGRTEEILLAKEYLLDSPMVRCSEELAEYARALFVDDRPLLSAARELTSKIFNEFTYDPEFTTVATPIGEVMEHKRGVCQDFAHLAIGCLRSLGYPARYVSGYLETLPPPGQEKLVGSDASHAWFALFSPTEGWFEFDPTNDNMPTEQHITTAWGRDYSDVTPLRGVIFDGGKTQKLHVAVDVTRIPE